MNDVRNMVFAIGRQFASGGRELGYELAKKLEIPYYDGDLISHAAEQSGLHPEAVERFDEKSPECIWHSYWFDTFPIISESLGQKTSNAQFDFIRSVAKKGGAVIVGRCADYILRDHKNLVSIFFHAPMECRIARFLKEHPEMESKVNSVITRADKTRAQYYSFYTGKTWGASESYDLSLRTDLHSDDFLVDMIISFAKAKLGDL